MEISIESNKLKSLHISLSQIIRTLASYNGLPTVNYVEASKDTD